jgi:hypothetical protein
MKKHRKQKTREYRIWRAMITRCCDTNRPAYVNYGGRGIAVCDRWRYSFSMFLEDMGVCPPEHTLERIDNSANYEPGNCRWATRLEQNNNRRDNVIIDIDGEPMTVANAIRHFGSVVTPSTVNVRMQRLGWDPRRAVSEPPRTFTWRTRQDQPQTSRRTRQAPRQAQPSQQ